MSQALDCFTTAIKAFLTETKATCLDLKGQNYTLDQFECILKLLRDSEVTELNLEGNDWSKGIESLRKFLEQTKIKTLKLGNFTVSDTQFVTLLDVLKDSEIVDMGAFVFEVEKSEIIDGRFLVPELLQSRLTKLNIQFHWCHKSVPRSFVEGLPSTSLTSLQLRTNGRTPNILVSLFSKLRHSQIKDLDLPDNDIDDNLIRAIHVYLKPSKIEKLNLRQNYISDASLNVLGQGLVCSSVIDLNLSGNKISGLNNFGCYLKNTKIRFLDLSKNVIKHRQMFAFPDFLKGSVVESLDISSCFQGDGVIVELLQSLKSTQVSKLNISSNFLTARSISEFAAVLKDTNLEDVNLTDNRLPIEAYGDAGSSPNRALLSKLVELPSERFDILKGCLQDSKLKCIRFDGPNQLDTISCLHLLEGTKNSSLFSIRLDGCGFSPDYADLFAKMLINSTFTHFNISCAQLSSIFPTFIVNLKYTSITHLNLSLQNIMDENVLILAANLKETKIIDLDLSGNNITCTGARTLAECCPQTSLISLNLDGNRIGTDGLDSLAKFLANSFIMTLSVEKRHHYLDSLEFFGDTKMRHQKYEKVPPTEKILWENRVCAHNLVVSFKKLFPKISNRNFDLHECIRDRNVNDFLEEYLEFYKKIVDLPAAISVLWQEESLSFSREELVTFFCDEFPRQFVEFIASWVESDVSKLVEFLKHVEKLGLVRIVEYLLLLRPLLTIDETEGILHPYVYTLLLKYQQPLCNLAIEPQGIMKITDYFMEHSHLEGALDLIKSLTEVKL